MYLILDVYNSCWSIFDGCTLCPMYLTQSPHFRVFRILRTYDTCSENGVPAWRANPLPTLPRSTKMDKETPGPIVMRGKFEARGSRRPIVPLQSDTNQFIGDLKNLSKIPALLGDHTGGHWIITGLWHGNIFDRSPMIEIEVAGHPISQSELKRLNNKRDITNIQRRRGEEKSLRARGEWRRGDDKSENDSMNFLMIVAHICSHAPPLPSLDD